jgi:uncharacterized lipoprotein
MFRPVYLLLIESTSSRIQLVGGQDYIAQSADQAHILLTLQPTGQLWEELKTVIQHQKPPVIPSEEKSVVLAMDWIKYSDQESPFLPV